MDFRFAGGQESRERTEQALLAIELRPNASLDPRGLRWLLGFLIAVNLAVAVGFALVNAWPSLPSAASTWRWSGGRSRPACACQRIETITITAHELVWQEFAPGKGG